MNGSQKDLTLGDFWTDDELREHAFWLQEAVRNDPLLLGIVEVDDTNGENKTKLVKALKASGSEVLFYLGDMLERYELKRPAHKPATPVYDRTVLDSMLLLAKDTVNELMAEGMSRDDAISEAARQWDPTLPTQRTDLAERLHAILQGKDGSSRRAKARRPEKKAPGIAPRGPRINSTAPFRRGRLL